MGSCTGAAKRRGACAIYNTILLRSGKLPYSILSYIYQFFPFAVSVKYCPAFSFIVIRGLSFAYIGYMYMQKEGKPLERNSMCTHAQIKKRVFFPCFRFTTLNQYILLMLLIIIGVAAGAFYIKNSGVSKSGLDGTGFFMQDILSSEAASKGFASLASSSFFPVSVLICIAYLFGLCAIGFPFETLIPIIHGVWLGASMASIDIRYGVKGLGICLLFIMPQALITSLAVMVASREGVKFSRSISKAVFSNAGKKLTASFRAYCCKYVFCFLLVGIASIIEAFSIIIFSKIFFT